MKTDYPELEGVEIDYIYNDGSVCKSKVVGVNYHIGITIVRIANASRFTVCLNKKLHDPKINIKSALNNYRKYFHEVVKGIKAGQIKGTDLDKHYERLSCYINTNCAFQ
ncbi:MAG TPA: hypothetical protein VMW50_03505 [Dehalococcoidia bacterium]|nr:hypothetical protein [Dehalococcoidia bacterium]